MGFFDALLSSNKRKWLSALSNKYEEEWGMIIKNFMIVDNINYEKFYINSKWENNTLSLYQDENDLANCSASYRKYFSDGHSNRKLNNSEIGYNNNWFYLAYPDVALWFGDNYENIKHSLINQGAEFSIYDFKNLQVLRYVVTMYKAKFGKLENEV
jgi:hypothetical protein